MLGPYVLSLTHNWFLFSGFSIKCDVFGQYALLDKDPVSVQASCLFSVNGDRKHTARIKFLSDLEAAGVDDLVADGALHQGEAELLLLRVHRVLLSRLATCKAHRRVGQHRLHAHKNKR